ncbi:hypothetical protein BDZ45DRAFT_507040 [Acephala macrosclerotiorum]|nr:hypothetical protein BDZ45DRAFT_507040 [Acephala macrosclerotiorum]
MAASLFTAANASLAAHFARRSNTHGKRYISYRALILTWKDAPAVGIAELDLALGKTYGFQTDVFELPLQDTGESLEERLQLFINAANNLSSLLLVCYVGNACIKKKRQIWTRPRQEIDDSVEIDWLHFQEKLEICQSDVILITDCEYGTDPDLRASSESSELDLQKRRKRMEIVSAPQRIPEDKQTFLVSLSQELKSIREPSFTLNRLISDLAQAMIALLHQSWQSGPV